MRKVEQIGLVVCMALMVVTIATSCSSENPSNKASVNNKMSLHSRDASIEQKLDTITQAIQGIKDGIGQQSTKISGAVDRLTQNTNQLKLYDLSATQLSLELKRIRSRDAQLYTAIAISVLAGIGFSLIFYATDAPPRDSFVNKVMFFGGMAFLLICVLLVVKVVLMTNANVAT